MKTNLDCVIFSPILVIKCNDSKILDLWALCLEQHCVLVSYIMKTTTFRS